ncbi:MAG: hypothetical protein MRQ09_00570 [Candidatus Midichloria sp.]|nr:hypothetical protein [Candidatus Midichloria sp.]
MNIINSKIAHLAMIGASVVLLLGPIAPLAAVPLAILVSQTSLFKNIYMSKKC